MKAHPENWEFYKLPKGEVRIDSNNQEGQTSTTLSPHEAFTDDDPTTEYRVDWWPANKAIAFPHVFEIDMGGIESFEFTKLGKTINMNYYPMNSYLQIFLAPYNFTKTEQEYSETNYSIDHEESLIWEGYFDDSLSETIDFDKEFTGRYIRLKFINNTIKWKDNNPGRTCISTIEIGHYLNNRKLYHLTNTKYVTLKNRWDETLGGCYYNGKGFNGYAANAVWITKDGVAHVIGDNSGCQISSSLHQTVIKEDMTFSLSYEEPQTAPTNLNNKENSIIEIRIPKYKPEFELLVIITHQWELLLLRLMEIIVILH